MWWRNVFLDKDMKKSFKKIKNEMNDHLDAINDNTNEINIMRSYLDEVDKKINKLCERIDNIEMKYSDVKYNQESKSISLTPKEQEIFLVLYSRSGDFIEVKEISKTIGFTEEMIYKYVKKLIDKGIPVKRKHMDSRVYLFLDSKFRNLHAKKNIVNLK